MCMYQEEQLFVGVSIVSIDEVSFQVGELITISVVSDNRKPFEDVRIFKVILQGIFSTNEKVVQKGEEIFKKVADNGVSVVD